MNGKTGNLQRGAEQKPVSRSQLSVAVLAMIAGASFPAIAQQQTPSPAQPTKIERIEVTGSNIKRVETEGVAPIQIVTREEIERSGKQTITEILRTLPSAGTGGLNDLTGSNSFSSGASSVSLRGLGSAATLVLLNGRRIAPYGLSDPNFGQSAVTNLDSLPLNAIERVEILKDGASAIYGSEAIAGVINIILRRDYKGGQVSVNGATNIEGLYNTASIAGSFGIGDIASDRYNVFLNVEGFTRERVGFRDAEDFLNRNEFFNSTRYRTGQRAFSSYAPQLNLYPAVDFNPATLGDAFIFSGAGSRSVNACPPEQQRAGEQVCRYDIWGNVDIVPKSERFNAFMRGTFDVGASLSLSSELSFNQIKTRYSGSPQVAGDFGSFFAATTNRVVNIPEVLPPGHPNNPTGDFVGYRYRFTDVGNTDGEVKSDTARFFFGGKFALGTWDFDAGALYNENKTEATSFNQIRTSVLTRAILDGTYNFANPSAGRVTAAQLRVNSTDNAKSSFTIFDFKGSTEVGSLPGGPVGLAFGIEYRKEERTATPDPLKGQGEILGFGAASASGDRNVTGAYAEVRLPVLRNLEFQVAGRSDRYSDYGRSTIPKVGAAWSITPAAKLRASYAEGFRAPSLTEISKSSVSAFTTVEDPLRCIDGTELACATPIGLLIEANPSVRPEEAKSYNVGFVIEPTKDTSISIDGYEIERTNEIQILSLATILSNENSSDPRFAGRVVRGRPGPGETVGPIQAIRTGFFNQSKTRLRGVDLDARVASSLGEYGKLTNRLILTFTDRYQIQGAPGQPLENVNETRDYPKYRFRLENTWERGNFSTTATLNYLSGFKSFFSGAGDAGACGNPTSQYLGYCKVSEHYTVDLATRYTGFKNLSLRLNIQNLFNRRPPADPLARPANLEWFQPYGTYFQAGATYSFK
jgi:iron complex outermembrane recepter protein